LLGVATNAGAAILQGLGPSSVATDPKNISTRHWRKSRGINRPQSAEGTESQETKTEAPINVAMARFVAVSQFDL